MSTRLYVPATLPMVRGWHAAGSAGPGPLAAHTVTREFARDYGAPEAPDDDELLQYEALTDAVQASAALDREPGDAAIAVVLEADVDSAAVLAEPGDGSLVSVLTSVPARAWVALYVQSRDTVGTEVTSLSGADLTWFAVQELGDALRHSFDDPLVDP